MKRSFIILINCLALVSFSGCLSTLIVEKTASGGGAAKGREIQLFSVNAGGKNRESSWSDCRQPSYQITVEKYAIKIDSNAPLVVSKQSDTKIKLNAGQHTLKLYAVSSKPEESEDVSYGKPSTRDIVITKGKEQTLKYTGPYRMLGAGQVEIVQP